MNRPLLKFLFLMSVLGFALKAGADDRWETLRAINWVENPTNQTTVGRFGELGPYQFRPGTWKMHTKRPFSQATRRDAADEVAVIHYEWIKRTLEQGGVDGTPFNIAMAWNCGVDNVLKSRVPAVSYDYANRVTNLVSTLKQRVPALAESLSPGRTAPPVLSLESPIVNFALGHSTAPRFELVLPAEPEVPVVYTDRVAAAEEAGQFFTFTTTATLTPRFSL